MKIEVPKRHILRPTLFTDMVQRVLRWERQKRCSSRKKQGFMVENIARMIFNDFFGGGGGEKMRIREDQ